MALELPPGVLNDVETDSSVQRHTTTALAAGRAGVCGANDFAVSQSSTPGMTVAVAAGYALVKGTTTSNQGLYSVHNDASVDDVAISPGDPTNDRHDIVGLLVRDAMYSGSDSDVVLHVVEGTPAGSPSDPTLPDSFLPLARVVVEANESTSILDADLTDLRVFTGDYRIDHPDDSGILSLSVNASFPGGSLRYRKRGIWVEVNCNIAKDGNNSSNTTFNLATLPAGFRPWGTVACAGVTSNPTNGVCRVTISPTTGVITANSLTINASANFSFYVTFSTF